MSLIFFFQAEDGIRDGTVTGVQTCALPICVRRFLRRAGGERGEVLLQVRRRARQRVVGAHAAVRPHLEHELLEIGRASCRERVYRSVVGGAWKRTTWDSRRGTARAVERRER